MRLRNFLIIIGLWVALLPHFGFSIAAENVLFSITGFVLIVSSFYVAAIEDKHRHKRIIQGETLEHTTEKFGSIISAIRKTTSRKQSPQSKTGNDSASPLRKEFSKEQPTTEDVFIVEENDGPPRIRKAVSDVKIKPGSEDDIVS